VPGTPCDTSFGPSDLDDGLLFFNFRDLKPDDEGEDTISLHVNTNDAYACLDISLTSNDDISSMEPELLVPDTQEDVNNTWDGELAQNIQMFWWADDGDNVYEEGENSISDGVRTLYNLATSTPFSAPLADSVTNVWNPSAPGPIPGNTTKYIAKAWCFGALTLNPVAAGQGVNPSVASGVTCNGAALNNLTQTDGATLDVAFRTVQARNNRDFVCDNNRPRLAKITVIKNVVNNNGGNNIVSDFQLFIDGLVTTPVTSSVTTTVAPGAYVVYETGVEGYEATIGGNCTVDGEVTLAEGDEKTCTITNVDLPSNIHLSRVIINDNPGHTNALPSAFVMKIDSVIVQNNSSTDVTSNTAHVITQTTPAGYTATISGDPECPAVLGGNVILNEGQEISCVITSDED
jgi:hypothetical protein